MSYGADALLRPSENQRRVVIFAQGRTGSTLLESLLASTGHFRERGELLDGRDIQINAPGSYIAGLARLTRGNFIFHVKLYHLTRDRSPPVDPRRFLSHLLEQDWTIVHLRRKNLLSHVLSSLVAERRENYHKFDDAPEEIRFRVDCRGFAEFMRQRERFAREERAALQGLPREEVLYERDLECAERHQPTVDRLLDALGLERRPVRTSLRKINRRRVEDIVENMVEFRQCLIANGWQGFLDD